MNRSRRKIEGNELHAEEEMLVTVFEEPVLWSCRDGDESTVYETLDDGLVRALQGLTKALTMNERAVLLLRAVADFKYRDIA